MLNVAGVNFVQPWFLVGTLVALLFGLLLFIGGLRARKMRTTFGEEKRIDALVTHDASKRRAWKGILLVVATALAFFAAARPQYGKAQRLIPATNVDVVIVLDYSKSMYARDVEPSRIFRAKVEVAKLVRKLRGARFAAVAFSGEPLSFPLTADGTSIATFLRQLEPNDMPVGGTAIARALEAARDILRRDPKSKDHKKVIVLITDGEDLEGSPTGVARSIANDKTVIHVVQIGTPSPEPIPLIGDHGEVLGWRTTDDGRPMTTELTPRGERQLKSIAEATEGKFIHAEKGSTGIEVIADELQHQMKTEYSERVEEVYADVFMYPLVLALVLLVIEALLTDAPRRVFVRKMPPIKMPTSFRAFLAQPGAAVGAGLAPPPWASGPGAPPPAGAGPPPAATPPPSAAPPPAAPPPAAPPAPPAAAEREESPGA